LIAVIARGRLPAVDCRAGGERLPARQKSAGAF